MSTASNITEIPDRPFHDKVVKESKLTPTIIYVCNSATLVCREFEPKFEALAAKYTPNGVRFCRMDYTSKTSDMFKFAPCQLPVTVLMCRDAWCRTIMGANLNGVEGAITQLLSEAKKIDRPTDSPMQGS